MQKKSPLFEALTGEINHRSLAVLLTVLVLLLHLCVIAWVLQPTESDKVVEPLKIIEVALLSEPSPKAEVTPPAQSKPPPPKIDPPKKKAVKPPVKKKEPVIPKLGDIPKPKSVIDEQNPPQPAASDSAQKPVTPAPGSHPTSNKPSGKSENVETNTKAASSGVVPLFRVKPKYPMRALSRHLEGWVKVEFTVTTAGTVASAEVVGASPTGIFDDAALDAIKQWKFKQKIVNGNAVTQRAVQVLKFTLVE